jgi:protein PhnA
MARGKEQQQARQNLLNRVAKDLVKRCKAKCELCDHSGSLQILEVQPVQEVDIDHCVMICDTCDQQLQLKTDEDLDIHHWMCLHESMWSEVVAVQVMAWRILKRLSHEAWARDLIDQMYMPDDVLAWAQKGMSGKETGGMPTFDGFGNELHEGDHVKLIKNLNVQGASFTAKRGTVVKNIHLTEDPLLVEGRINQMQIVLKVEFLKKI